MNTLELLDLAARAQGWIDYPEDSSEQGAYWHTDPACAPFGPTLPKSAWSPDTDDGDCARMEAALGINVEWYSDSVVVSNRRLQVRAAAYAAHGGDRNAARRMASLQLAAATRKARPELQPGEDSTATMDGKTYIYRTGDTC